MERGRNATRSSRDDDGGKTKATTSGDEKSGAIVGNISGDSKKSLDKRKRKYSRSRSRSRSLSSHSSSLSNSSSESELISASSDSESNSLLSSGNEDERRRRKKKSKKESVKDKKKSKKSRDKEKKKEKKDKKDKKDKKKKKIRKDKKTKKKTSGAGSIADSWGSHGIITSAEMYTKEAEFRSWLIEIKHISPEDRNSKQYFEEFVEDFNTATLPHEKYYNMDAWDRRMLISNQYADGTGGGTGSGGGGLEFDFARDEQLLKQQQRNAKMSRLPEVSMSTDELRDLKRIQDERLEAEKLKKLGFKPKDSMGVRYDQRMRE
ncbi:hypothetical protein HK100_001040 [Physocladia obscura]|uniref:Uncharacterized protein n=1 Tax=Physocladia obscura TaxID=109957 RepID=A0AAD5T3H1_9FUNG|nr:hypothetical protein HK100_001040 [Physocladia obscura]